MDYIIECRPSGQFIEALAQAELYELSRLFGKLVFFARNISCEDGPGRNDVAPMVEETIGELRRSLPPSMWLDVARVDVYQGSVIILILVSVVSLPAAVVAGPVVGGGFAVGGLALWAADKFFGGALEECGKIFTTKLVEKISKWWNGKGKQSPPTTIINPREIAESEAQRVAAQHGCKPALLTGGTSVEDHVYEYIYQLYDCGRRLLKIRVDSQSKEVPVNIIVS
jgi:hypothetical protein